MADNINVTDYAGVSKTARTTDTGSVHVPHHAVANAAGSHAAQVDANNNGDALATSASLYSLLTGALGLVYNGTTWDRIRSAIIGDGVAGTGIPAKVPYLWNGTTYDRTKSAPGGTGVMAVNSEGRKSTYRYAANSFAMVAAPTDAIVIQGSATKTLRIKNITLTGAATAAGTMPVNLIKRSAADATTGVLTSVTPALMDSGDGAATGVVSTVGTGNFGSLGASAGLVGAARLCFTALATGLGVSRLVWDFGGSNKKACILRGTSEFLCINFAGAAIPSGGVLDYEIEIEEDAS